MEKVQPWDFSDKRVYDSRSKRRPPTAPILEEQEVYKKYAGFASKSKIKKALILGVTPELRDIAIENNLESYAVDLSRNVADLYSSLMKNKNHPNDKVIIQNWLDMDFPDSSFGIVMADASFCNLPNIKSNEFLMKKLNKLLCSGGYVVLRNIFYPTQKQMPLKELVRLFRDKKIDPADFFMTLRVVSYIKKVFDPKTCQYNAKKNFEIIEEDYKKGIFNKEEFDFIMGYKNNIINTFIPEKKFIKIFTDNGFKLVERYEGSSFLFQKYSTMLAFQKK